MRMRRKGTKDASTFYLPQWDEVPEHVSILAMSCWVSINENELVYTRVNNQSLHFIPLLSVDERWEENWISNEENWRIVANQIPNTIFWIEFNSKAAWIANGISATALTTDRWETNSDWCTFANRFEYLGCRVFLNETEWMLNSEFNLIAAISVRLTLISGWVTSK